MVLYQAHYTYGPSADDALYYSGSDGHLYSNREACEKEVEFRLHPEKYLSEKDRDIWSFWDIPENATIYEVEVKDSFIYEENE